MPCAPASRGQLSCRGGLTAPYYSHHWPGHPLTHTPCYSTAMAASHRSRTSEPSYSSPRGHPLPRLPRLCVVPFLGLAVVHRPGALGAAWSRNGFHRTWTVRGEADSWVHGRSKEVPPYYTENNDSSTWQGPTRWATVFRKKTFPLDCWDAPAISSHARKCVHITGKKRIRPLTAGTHQLHLRTQRSA